MTIKQFSLFICGLVLPMIYQRGKFALNRLGFYNTPFRKKSGLNIHHGHWGFLIALVSTSMLVFGFHNVVSISLAGLGWGLMLDEIIPMLKMPSPGRGIELDVYARAKDATIVLISAITVLFTALFFFLS